MKPPGALLDVATLPNLTLDQERDLVARLGPCDVAPRRPGGPARRSFDDPMARRARDRLLMHHDGLVRSMAAKVGGLGVSVPDLHQHLLVVALEALASFDGSRGARVSTWLQLQLRTPISEFVGRTRGPIAIPGAGDFRVGITRYNKSKRTFIQAHGREPDHTERKTLALAAGTTLTKLDAYEQAGRGVVQLGGDPADEDQEGADLPDVSAPGEADQVAALDASRLRQALGAVADQLTARELLLLHERLMPAGAEAKRSTIARRWGETQTYVEISEVLLARKLRALLTGGIDPSPSDGVIILPCAVRGPLHGRIYYGPKLVQSGNSVRKPDRKRPEQLRLHFSAGEFGTGTSAQ